MKNAECRMQFSCILAHFEGELVEVVQDINQKGVGHVYWYRFFLECLLETTRANTNYDEEVITYCTDHLHMHYARINFC